MCLIVCTVATACSDVLAVEADSIASAHGFTPSEEELPCACATTVLSRLIFSASVVMIMRSVAMCDDFCLSWLLS